MAGEYDFSAIEAKWQRYWEQNKTFRAVDPGQPGSGRPKFYVLDMFPYPSGAGLHVGHPEGYTATDIVARYKRMKGFNVLHPMGYDAFGLPAEQYAVEHGVHPRITTEQNIGNIRRQIKSFGFSYDWDRELSTTDVEYYRWTQWIFLQMFNAWYDDEQDKARPIAELVQEFESGRRRIADAHGRGWRALSDAQRRRIVDDHRLAYQAEAPVNWCPALGTVLANEEVTSEGRSERGNHPVFRRALRQWMLRITKYADRLERDLDDLDWPESIKLMQRNWIGRSEGADVDFLVARDGAETGGAWRAHRRAGGLPATPEADVIRVFTTRPDTLFGATYMVLAPEHPLVERITTPGQAAAVRSYVESARNKSELERTAESKAKTGVFTGAYAINPASGERIPVWVADYVLISYGTGAIMAVPGHDQRDFEFAKQFDLPIRVVVMPPEEWIHDLAINVGFDAEYCERTGRASIIQGLQRGMEASANLTSMAPPFTASILDGDPSWVRQVLIPAYLEHPGIFPEAFAGDGANVNSPAGGTSDCVCDINGLPTLEAKGRITEALAAAGLGRIAVNHKLRDWLFSRQRYWGEPFPILHGPDGETIAVDESELPVVLPEMEDFSPAISGDPAGVPEPPLGRAADWVNVRRGGRAYRRELNTMPQWAGSCWYFLRFADPRNDRRFVDPVKEAYWMKDGIDLYVGGAEHAVLHLLYSRFWHKVLYDLGHVSTREPFRKLFNQGMIRSFAYRDGRGVYIGYDQVEQREDGAYHRGTGEKLSESVEKMSKSLKNVINPDEVIREYGADVFRLYEMYMGPLEATKPWNPRDIVGMQRFCQKVWQCVAGDGGLSPAVVEAAPDEGMTRLLHKTIKKVGEDIEALRFNTAIAELIKLTNELVRAKVRPRAIIEPFVLLAAPFAPHLAEELWQRLGHTESLAYEPWPAYEPELTVDPMIEYPVQVNGKVRTRITVAAGADEAAIREQALGDPRVREILGGKPPRKVIVVPKRLVNIVSG